MVESQTLVGNKQHPRGVVEARIVKGDIPVQSGIVHLIDRPLVIVTNTLAQMVAVGQRVSSRLYSSVLHTACCQAGHRFQIFAAHLQNYPELGQRIEQTWQGTILIPTREAFERVRGRDLDETILGLHFLPETILGSDRRIRQLGGAAGVGSSNK